MGQVARSFAGDGEIADAADSVSLMAEAVEVALVDCGAGDWRASIDTVAVVGGLWRYRDPAALVAAECGIEPSRTVHSSFCSPLSAIGFGAERSTLP